MTHRAVHLKKKKGAASKEKEVKVGSRCCKEGVKKKKRRGVGRSAAGQLTAVPAGSNLATRKKMTTESQVAQFKKKGTPRLTRPERTSGAEKKSTGGE